MGLESVFLSVRPLRCPRSPTSRAREPPGRRPSQPPVCQPPVQGAAGAASNRVGLVERGERQIHITLAACARSHFPSRVNHRAVQSPRARAAGPAAVLFGCFRFCGSRRRAVAAWPKSYGVASARAGSRARAYKRETRRLLTNRPCLGFVYEESRFQKNVYASAIGLCKDSIIMQSTKPSNSDFWRPFSM